MSPHNRRFLAFTLLSIPLFASCISASPAAALPSIEMTLTTPSTPLTYGWVMVDNGQAWGVQIGPKVDASGTHVAVYGWQNCAGTCGWEFFHEYDALAPGSVHDYSIVWGGDGWHLSFDGRVVAVLNPGTAGARTESNTGERTTS